MPTNICQAEVPKRLLDESEGAEEARVVHADEAKLGQEQQERVHLNTRIRRGLKGGLAVFVSMRVHVYGVFVCVWLTCAMLGFRECEISEKAHRAHIELRMHVRSFRPWWTRRN